MTGGGVYPGLEHPEKEEKPPLPSYPDVSHINGDHDAPTGSWQRGKSVLDCNRHMLENQLACDIWFKVGVHKEVIGAHRYVLQSRSGVFYAMLDGHGADRSNIDLPSVHPKVFWQLLRYLYYEELYPDSDTVLDLLALTEKYDIITARNICLQYLPSCLTVKTACDILESAHHYNDQDLDKETMLFIRKHGEDVVQSKGMERLCRECLNKVITMEGLDLNPTVREEVSDRWARKQCEEKLKEPSSDNKQSSLGDVIYVKRDEKKSHRFILDSCTDAKLSPQDDPDSPPPLYSELTIESADDIPDDESVSSMSSAGTVHSQFSRQASHTSWPDLNKVTRFKEVGDSVPNNGTADAISFTVDHNIYLYGFGIYGSKKAGEASFKVDTIMTRKKKDIVMESIAIKGAGVILPVMFERPVKVEKGKPYTLEIYVAGPDSYVGEEGVPTASDGSVKFTFTNATKVKGNRTTQKKGQIPRLFFLPYGK